MMMSKIRAMAIFAALSLMFPSLASAEIKPVVHKPPLLAQLTPPPLPQPPAASYFYAENGKPVGPVTLAEIQAKIAAGVIKPDTLVWKSGTPSWVEARRLTEIAPLFAGTPAPAPAPSSATVDDGCSGKTVFSEDFRQVDASWGVNPETVTVEDGKVKIKAAADGHQGFSFPGRPFVDADYCVTIQSPNNLKDVNSSQVIAGFTFWERDNSGYLLLVAPNGAAALLRAVNGHMALPPPARFHLFAAVKKGAGAKNMLRVTTNGNSIITYVNGQKFASIRGEPPEGGGVIGFYAQSEAANRDSWKFLNLRVTDRSQ
jgi:hypothetical protein